MGDILPAAPYGLLVTKPGTHPLHPWPPIPFILCLFTGGVQGQEKHQPRNGGVGGAWGLSTPPPKAWAHQHLGMHTSTWEQIHGSGTRMGHTCM